MDGMLSQEEINALLNGVSDEPTEEENVVMPDDIAGNDDAGDGEFLSEMEKDIVGEISNISMGTAATTLSSLVNQKVDISIPVVSFAKWEDLVMSYDRPCVFLQIQYREGLDGNNILILKEHDVKIIADLMMGGDGTNTDGELGELHLSAISEAMNQMMGSASTSLSSMLNIKIDISPPIASLIDLNDNLNEGEISDFLTKGFVRNAFKMTIGDLVESEIMQLFPIDFAKQLCSSFAATTETPEPAKQEKAPTPPPAPAPAPEPAAQPVQMDMNAGMENAFAQQQPQPMNMNQPAYGMQGAYAPNMMGVPPMPYPGMPYGQPVMQEVNVQPAQFQAFSTDLAAVTQKENINLIMDVPLEVSVELGRTSKSIQDILEFAPGTIIELDKIAGEPIDVLVNGKYVAKGEVVVIEESFGVRVTEIIK